jgi:hypothetical protein
MKRIILTAATVLISALTVFAQTETPVVSIPASAKSHKHHNKQHNKQKSEHSHHHHNQH